MKKTRLIENVDDQAWKDLKILALQYGVKMGEMLGIILETYLKEIEQKKKFKK